MSGAVGTLPAWTSQSSEVKPSRREPLTRHALRRDYIAIHQDVYIRRGTEITPVARAKAAWLRSKRRGILAGFSASALHGARWINPARPAAIIDTNRRPTRGVEATADRIEEDEICVIDGMRVTTPARTALDLACRYPVDAAVAALDALARATRLKMADVDLLAGDTAEDMESAVPVSHWISSTRARSRRRKRGCG